MRLLPKNLGLVAVICAFVASFAIGAPTTASAAPVTTIYNNIPSPLPGNLPSWGFEATGTQEFGDRVGFTGTARRLLSVTQTMSSWGCQVGHWYSGDCVTAPNAMFTHDVTLNLYNVAAGNAPGNLIGTKTQTFAMPYRPSVDLVHCTGGRWFDGTTCFNGKAFTITFDFSAQNLTLPNQVIFGVAYNTTHFGYHPIGETAPCFIAPGGGCPYDSLNVALADPATTLSAGTNPAPADAYQDTNYSSCANGAIHPFGLDAGCWTGFKPATKFDALECHKGDGDGDFEDKDGHKHHAHFHHDSCGTGGGDVEDDDSSSGKHFQSGSTDSATYSSSADSATITMVGTGLDDGVPVGFTMVAVDYHGITPAIYTLTLTNGRTFSGALLNGTVLLQ